MNTERDLAVLKQFLELSVRNEQLCAELYHYYSDLFLADPEVSRLWKKTALEEENHQKQFELALRLIMECDFELVNNVERAMSVNHKFVKLLEYVRSNPPDLVTALQRAIEMEEAISDLHMGSAVKFKDKNTSDLFKALYDADQGHIESLKFYLTIAELPGTEMPT